MKILFINGHLHIGGVEKSLINLLKSIDYSQHQVDLLLVEDLGEYCNEIPSQVNLIYYDFKPTYGPVQSVLTKAIASRNKKLLKQKIAITAANKINRKLLRLLPLPRELKEKYDCAIAYRVGMPLDLISYVIQADVKCVWWHHGEFDYSQKEIKSWNEAFARVDHIICVSESSRRMIEPYFSDSKEKMSVIPNMLIPNDIKQAADAFNPYEKENDKRVLVSVGRMSAEKHMADTVEVMNQLIKQEIRNIVWYLIGDGAERANIEEKINEYGLQEYFCLVGNQANPYPYIKNADLFVHPSRVESQGICVLEAMVLEKKCVVVRSAGTDEFVVNGYNALQAEQSVNSLTKQIVYGLKHFKEIDYRTGQRATLKSFMPDENMTTLIELIKKTK